jgi:hypothetical protein
MEGDKIHKSNTIHNVTDHPIALDIANLRKEYSA